MKDPMQTIKTLIARALVRLAIAAAPADQAKQIETNTRPIWRPSGQ